MLRKKGCVPSALTQNVKDFLASPEIENIFENSDFILMLNQASGDRQILAKQLNISPHQLSYVDVYKRQYPFRKGYFETGKYDYGKHKRGRREVQ